MRLRLGFLLWVFLLTLPRAATAVGHAGAILTMSFSPDGRWLATGSQDNTIKLWDPASGRLLGTLWGHSGQVESLAFSKDSRLLVSASADGSVILWNPESRRLSGSSPDTLV